MPIDDQRLPPWLGEDLRRCVQTLAAAERPSASPGEREAAEWIAERLRDLGLSPRIEAERAHGGYWWPLGLLNAVSGLAAALAAKRKGPAARAAATFAGVFSACAIWDDVGGGRQWFRRLLPRRDTFNVVARAGGGAAAESRVGGGAAAESRVGDGAAAESRVGGGAAAETILIVAHHDAAHSGLVFHPALPRLAARAFPKLHARSKQSAPIMYATWLGPVLSALGGLVGCRRALRLGCLFGAGAAVAMADIGTARTVPGANDNLTAVAVLLALARRLREKPVSGVEVLLLSTGSEESFMEGMQGFMRRHGRELDPARTAVLCLECLGGPTLTMLEGEGMLRMRTYSPRLRSELADAAKSAGIPMARDLRTVAATDALVALRRGYAAATLASVDETKFPSNYHWPSDTPENVTWETVEAAFAVVERLLERRAAGVGAP